MDILCARWVPPTPDDEDKCPARLSGEHEWCLSVRTGRRECFRCGKPQPLTAT